MLSGSAMCPFIRNCGDLLSIASPDSVKVDYEIGFTRYFYQPQPLHAPEEIWAEIPVLERESEALLGGLRVARGRTSPRERTSLIQSFMANFSST